MGISTNIYAYYGIKLPWDDAFSEAYDDVYDDQDTPNVLLDGMSGEYMVFGVRLYNSGDFRWGMRDGDAYKEIDIDSLPGLGTKYCTQFCKKFPQFSHYLVPPFKLIILTHSS